MHITELLSLFFITLIVGGWMAAFMVFVRGYKRMSAVAYIEADQINSNLACKYFAPMIPITIAADAAYMVALDGTWTRPFTLSFISAAVLLVTAIFVKVKVLPMNDDIKKWDPNNPPAGWQQFRVKWSRYHTLRTMLGLVAFFLQATAVIWK